jgi:2-(1,2-epoxy-1,2-dihydrophenyl)acetyl-CoA isomerase
LDRPERLNALDLDHVVALRDALRELATDSTVRVVVLTGAGRGFSAGGDVTAMTGGGGGGGDDSGEPLDLRSIMEVSELLHGMPAVTIAAVNGPCAGAGLSFACACDLRYAARSALFVSAFLRVGSSGDHGSAWVLTRAVGPAKARELLLLGDRVGADEAWRIGLVSEVVDDDALLDHVAGIAARLAEMPPTATRLMKANLDDALTLPLGEYLDRETERFEECSGSDEAIAAAKAFLESNQRRSTGV